ncbi:MAG: hypothetical protein FJ104_14560 [Deltaproteobacteria bacterium]|nr:hypothetical protein [Deltaproteobacteria bacterium]
MSSLLSAIVLAAYIRAALRGGPLSFFDLRYAAPEGLARSGELLAALSAGVASRELACDGSGRFSLRPVEVALVGEASPVAAIAGSSGPPSGVRLGGAVDRLPCVEVSA